MAFAGEKRSSENPTDVATNESEECRPIKRPAMFRASMLKPAPSKFDTASYSESKKPSESDSTPLTGGFMKLERPDIKPRTVVAPTFSAGAGSNSLGKTADGTSNTTTVTMASSKEGGADKHENPFLQFLSGTHSVASFSTFSAAGQSGGFAGATTSSFLKPAESNGEGSPSDKEGSNAVTEQGMSGVETDTLLSSSQGTSLIGNHGATSILPEVQVVTGEEGEKNVLQMSGRLFLLDASNHTWRERGRGELRLNDTTHGEGECQSRLVMRASGSYRVLLNTSLWADMKCDRANQKSIRMAAQDGDKISVFLIMGLTKDVQQLYSAIDRRLEAMRKGTKRNVLQAPDSSDDASPPHSCGPIYTHDGAAGISSGEEDEGGEYQERAFEEGPGTISDRGEEEQEEGKEEDEGEDRERAVEEGPGTISDRVEKEQEEGKEDRGEDQQRTFEERPHADQLTASSDHRKQGFDTSTEEVQSHDLGDVVSGISHKSPPPPASTDNACIQ